MFSGTRQRQCNRCIWQLCEVSERRGPWSCQMCSSYDYIFGIEFYCRVGPRKDLLLLSCPGQRSIVPIVHFVHQLATYRNQFLYIWVYVRFCSVHCACRRGGIWGIPGRPTARSHWTGERRDLSVISARLVQSNHLDSSLQSSRGSGKNLPDAGPWAPARTGSPSGNTLSEEPWRRYTAESNSWSTCCLCCSNLWQCSRNLWEPPRSQTSSNMKAYRCRQNCYRKHYLE